MFQRAPEELVLKFLSGAGSTDRPLLCFFSPSRSSGLQQLLRVLQRPVSKGAARETQGALQDLPAGDAHLGPGKGTR